MASKLDEESGVTMGSMCGCNDETVVIDGNKVASVIESAQFVLIESRRDRLEALKAAFGLLSAQVRRSPSGCCSRWSACVRVCLRLASMLVKLTFKAHPSSPSQPNTRPGPVAA